MARIEKTNIYTVCVEEEDEPLMVLGLFNLKDAKQMLTLIKRSYDQNNVRLDEYIFNTETSEEIR